MPLIDVSELLTDPDFATTFDLVRSTEIVGSNGMASRTEEITTGVVGVVTSNTGQQLVLLDDGSRISDSITVHSKTMLYASMDKRPADIVVWNGNRYVVKNVNNWGGWGAGFCAATCEFLGVNQ